MQGINLNIKRVMHEVCNPCIGLLIVLGIFIGYFTISNLLYAIILLGLLLLGMLAIVIKIEYLAYLTIFFVPLDPYRVKFPIANLSLFRFFLIVLIDIV